MKTIRRGDEYPVDHMEIVCLVVGDNSYYVVADLDPDEATCKGCPLDPNTCEDWMDIPWAHRIKSLEEVVE